MLMERHTMRYHELDHSVNKGKEAPSNKRTCYYCFKSGHIWSQCPEKVALGKRRKGNPAASSDSNSQSAILSTATIVQQLLTLPPLIQLLQKCLLLKLSCHPTMSLWAHHLCLRDHM